MVCCKFAEPIGLMGVVSIEDEESVAVISHACSRHWVEVLLEPHASQLLICPSLGRMQDASMANDCQGLIQAECDDKNRHLALHGFVRPHSRFRCAPWKITDGCSAVPSVHIISMIVMRSQLPSSSW